MKLTVLYSQWSWWKDFTKLSSFFKYFTIHSTSFSCFGGLIVLLFSLYFLLLIIFGFFNVSDNVSVSSLVRFLYTFSVEHPLCNFSSIAAKLQDLVENTAVRVDVLHFHVEITKTANFPWPYILLNNMVEILFAVNLEFVLCKLIPTGFLYFGGMSF